RRSETRSAHEEHFPGRPRPVGVHDAPVRRCPESTVRRDLEGRCRQVQVPTGRGAKERDTPIRASRRGVQGRRIDDHTWDIVIKVNGERRILVHNVVSDDGKTMKGVTTSVTSQGQTTSEVVIYEKQ